VSENGESTSRPKTWPLRVLEVSGFCFLLSIVSVVLFKQGVV
jgi:hypothetical protein